jgi:hypothetical protein
MKILNRDEALEAMTRGAVIGFASIKGVEMWQNLAGKLMFSHRDGEIEYLDKRTISDNDGYVILRDKTRLVFKK